MNSILNSDNTEDWSYAKDSNSWVSEGIWGHRLKQGQSINILLNEFLCVSEAMHRAGVLLGNTAPNSNPSIQTRKARELRVILFFNPYLEQVSSKKLPNDQAWQEWFNCMLASLKDWHPSDFSYLRNNIHKFQEFADHVNLLRRITIDPGTSRKWSHQLLFPIGPEALYVPTDEKFARDRILFTRTGEISYLMLSRSSAGLRQKLKPHFELLFQDDSQKNNLLKKLLSDTNEYSNNEALGTYLPYKEHPAFDRLAQDLLNVFELGLPNQDSLDILKYLLAFNLYLYILETAHEWSGGELIPPVVCEILSPKMDLVRRVSASTKRENEDLCKKAVEKYIYASIESNEPLTEILNNSETPEDTKVQALKEALESNPLKIKDVPSTETVEELVHSIIKKAKAHCQTGVLAAADSLGKICGLSSRRKTNRYRYAPSDELLNALILANVKDRTEEATVLEKLYQRYGLVIGKEQAEKVLGEDRFDASQFEKNGERFTQRLIALGLAERLSDACTYVSNHYVSED